MEREITHVVIHCTATKEGVPFGRDAIDRSHRARGFREIGYHYVVNADGSVEVGRPEHKQGAHVKGHNKFTIGIVYVGGLDSSGKPKDTRTLAQITSLKILVMYLQLKYPKADIVGHRDLSPDKDGDGKVEKHEWLKACPCFDVHSFVQNECCIQ